MADAADLDRACRHDAVIETLQCEAVQVDKIAGHLDTDNVAAIAAFDRAEHIAFDEHRALIGHVPSFEQARAIAVFFHGVDESLDVIQVIPVQMFPQSSGEELAGQRVSGRPYVTTNCVHRER
ncbi:hypothetical protein [Qipengyuania nanhaisediminis]|uniref:hypothetical protein n=1 Tax=Qipengyuania nanhaisediminis TaxID=604088 RepID=UPI001FE01F56|nr:hypothetical protein [Qipengyuania nanhaisediminis]